MAVNTLDKEYAATLKALRKKNKLIQYTLATQLGLESQQQYSDFEKGKKHFTNDFILKICAVFKISVLEFVRHQQQDPSVYYLSAEDYTEIQEAKTAELKLTLYKRLFLESKIENVETCLKSFNREIKSLGPGKHKIHVII